MALLQPTVTTVGPQSGLAPATVRQFLRRVAAAEAEARLRALENPLSADSAKYLRAYLRDRGRDEFRRQARDVRLAGRLAQVSL